MNATDYDFVITHPDEGYKLLAKLVGNAHILKWIRRNGEGARLRLCQETDSYADNYGQILSKDREWTQ